MKEFESPMESSRMTTLPAPALLRHRRTRSAGKMRPIVLLWALGVPLPIVLIILMVRGCS